MFPDPIPWDLTANFVRLCDEPRRVSRHHMTLRQAIGIIAGVPKADRLYFVVSLQERMLITVGDKQIAVLRLDATAVRQLSDLLPGR